MKHASPALGQSDTLHLLESDTTLDLHVFTDNTILEVYWQGGRVAMTLGLDGTDNTGVDVFSFATGGDAAGGGGGGGHKTVVHSVEAWHMNSIWTSPEGVVAQAAAGQ